MSTIDGHLDAALVIIQSARTKLDGHSQNDDGGGGFGSWVKDKAQAGFNTAQNGWQNLPGKDIIEEPFIIARDTIIDNTVDGWNKLPGNEIVEDKVGDLTDNIPFNNVVGASIKAFLGQSEISIDQDGIDLITKDPAWSDFQQNQVSSVVSDIQQDSRFGNEAFTIELDPASLQFGGKRGSFNPLDPSSIDTLKVGGNELTWLLRHASIQTVAQVDANGTITINYKVDDTLDLRPGEGRSDAYNNTTAIMGTIWHDILGSEEATITGEWSEVIEPDNS